MMRKKEKVITMTVTLILVVILICIKVTHLVIIERPLKQCRIPPVKMTIFYCTASRCKKDRKVHNSVIYFTVNTHQTLQERK